MKFLESFYKVTLKFSASLSVTSHLYFHDLYSIKSEMTSFVESEDFLLGSMVASMKKKYDKYWGTIENVNTLLLVAIVLDPRYKLDYVTFFIGEMYGETKVEEVAK